jgi:hypothetical protein
MGRKEKSYSCPRVLCLPSLPKNVLCCSLSVLLFGSSFVQNSYKCRAFRSVCMVAAALYPDALFSSLIISFFYLRTCLSPHAPPSIHPSSQPTMSCSPIYSSFLLFFDFAWRLAELLMLNNRCAAAAPPPKDSRVHISFPWTSSHMTCTASSSTSQGCIPQCPASSIHLFPSFDSDRQGKRIDDHRWLVRRSILVDTLNE